MYGYYFFFGRGDWGMSRDGSFDPTFGGNVPTRLLGDWGTHRQGTLLADAPEWTSAWDYSTWTRRIDFLVDRLEADTLLLLMNGYELPYPSERFPEAVERDHANVREEFLQSALDYACRRGLRPYVQFCTTGHAVAYATEHPECTTVAEDGTRHATNLCHHHPLGRAYARGVMEEVLTRYHGFRGVSFHPPENAVPCYCSYCRTAFESATGTAFDHASPKAIMDFYWRSCLAFQHELEQAAQAYLPAAQVLAITIPGRFEEDFAVIAPEIPLSTLIMHWDYWSFGESIPELETSLRTYRSRGHRVGFIPSSGWNLDKCGAEYGRQVIEQITRVRAMGIDDLCYFVGGIWNEATLLATSWKGRNTDLNNLKD